MLTSERVTMSAAIAKATFELANNIQLADASIDAVYKYNAEEYNKTLSSRPWVKEYVEIYFRAHRRHLVNQS